MLLLLRGCCRCYCDYVLTTDTPIRHNIITTGVLVCISEQQTCTILNDIRGLVFNNNLFNWYTEEERSRRRRR